MDPNKILTFCEATLTAISLVCMIIGYKAIKQRFIQKHRYYMTAAFICSALFLILFITRYMLFGYTAYNSSGWDLWVYYFIFFSHEPLAVINVPLVIVTFLSGLRKSFIIHREIAPIALRIWLYVSVTGILIFLFKLITI